ncbi:MAG: hypothetical protein J7J38_01055 [Candidatus Aenigmarchaeota archaeon]|nr:hypothetical protein [Candidatus Aenigmarchaeota archaeon]
MDTRTSSKKAVFLVFLIMAAMAFLPSEIEMPTPEATPKPSGFELVFAVIALTAAAYLVKRSKRRKDRD